MGNETDNELGRACIGYRDAEELPQPCPTGELPTGNRHRCDSCHGTNTAARKAAKQARYRRRRADALGRLDEAERVWAAEAERLGKLIEGAIEGFGDELRAYSIRGEEALAEAEAAVKACAEVERRLTALEQEARGLVFRLSRLELLAQQPWWRRRRHWRRSQLPAGAVSAETDEG